MRKIYLDTMLMIYLDTMRRLRRNMKAEGGHWWLWVGLKMRLWMRWSLPTGSKVGRRVASSSYLRTRGRHRIEYDAGVHSDLTIFYSY